jgi:hypothetical protein
MRKQLPKQPCRSLPGAVSFFPSKQFSFPMLSRPDGKMSLLADLLNVDFYSKQGG